MILLGRQQQGVVSDVELGKGAMVRFGEQGTQ